MYQNRRAEIIQVVSEGKVTYEQLHRIAQNLLCFNMILGVVQPGHMKMARGLTGLSRDYDVSACSFGRIMIGEQPLQESSENIPEYFPRRDHPLIPELCGKCPVFASAWTALDKIIPKSK